MRIKNKVNDNLNLSCQAYLIFPCVSMFAAFSPGQSHLNTLINKKETRRWERTTGQIWKASLPKWKTPEWSEPSGIDCGISSSWRCVASCVELRDGWKSRNVGRQKKPFAQFFVGQNLCGSGQKPLG